MYTELFEAMMKVLNGADFKNRDNHLALVTVIHHISSVLVDEYVSLRKEKKNVDGYSVLYPVFRRLYDRFPYEWRLICSIHTGACVRKDPRYADALRKEREEGILPEAPLPDES